MCTGCFSQLFLFLLLPLPPGKLYLSARVIPTGSPVSTQQEHRPLFSHLQSAESARGGLAHLWGGELGFASINRGDQEHVLQDRCHVLSHDLLLLEAAVVLQGDDDRVWRSLGQDSNIHHN